MSSNLLKQGLKGYAKQFSFNFDNLVDVHINLSKKAHDIILTWPLISTSGHTPFSASLIYSHQNRNTSSFFGNGINLNYFKNLTPYATHIVVKNPDGTTGTYEQSKNYKNDETQCKINVIKTMTTFQNKEQAAGSIARCNTGISESCAAAERTIARGVSVSSFPSSDERGRSRAAQKGDCRYYQRVLARPSGERGQI